MNLRKASEESFPALAPVQLEGLDAVSHSLAILSAIYNYNHWIFSMVRDFLGPRVVEVGSGVGNITQFLLNAEKIACLEPYEPYRNHLANRFRQHGNVSVHPWLIQDCPCGDVGAGQFDSVVCLNVLEHIDDDVGALEAMRSLVVPGGHVIVLVPALQSLYGEMDRAMGHVRRYTLPSLRTAFADAGLRPWRGRYMNMVGALGWFWRGRVARKARISPAQTLFFDRLVPVLSAVERLLPVMFGQSVIVAGRV
jgi:SAM-dependent methyltransferase